MRDLVEAACGGQNPLVKLSQQVRGDVTRRQDGLGSGMSASRSGPSRQAPGTFHMASLLQEMRTVDQGANQWANEFQPAQTLHSEWDKEFLQGSSQQSPRIANSLASPQPVASHQLYGHQNSYMHSMGSYRTPMTPSTAAAPSRQWAEDILTQSDLRAADEKSNLIKVAKEYVQAEGSANLKQTDFYKFVENVANEGQQQKNDTFAKTSEPAKEVSKDDTEFWHDLSKKWNDSAALSTKDPFDRNRDILPESYRSYRFNEQTPIDESVVQNPFQEGLEKLKQGDLPSAVLLFEAAVKKDSAHVEAWQYLGTTQAQNEQDVQAIAALRQCIVLDPQNLGALMSLGVSYYNEGLQRQACEALREWLRANAEYSHLVRDTEPQLDLGVNITTMEKKRLEEITDLYIRAARMHPENPDADVQSGLGVLLNMSFEFDKAIDCFKAAVSVRPDDAGSWNRLGATLANSGRSAEAVEAYRHALQLYPGYIRARFNLGISCINMSCYNEAAEHFISALNLQKNAKADQYALSRSTAMSDNIWNTLRMSITLMNRSELYSVVEARDLDQLSRIFLKT